MSIYIFTGDWSPTLTLTALHSFQSRGGAYTSVDSNAPSTGIVTLNIEDELNDDPDPLPEQLAAINYLLENQEAIINAILRQLYNDYPGILSDYGGVEGEDGFPVVNTPNDLKKSIGISILHVQLAHKDGIAYIGYEGGCTWDEEHGIGFLMHKDRVVYAGGADEAFSTWRAYEDSGITKEEREQKRKAPLPKPQRYMPHPKYGTLKPSQEDANKSYEYKLVERGYNDEFIALIESGALSVNDRPGDWLNMSLLERACQFNNEVVARYILTKNPASLEGCIQNLADHCNKDLVDVFLAAGVDIDSVNNVGETALSRMVSGMSSCYWHPCAPERIEKIKGMIEWLIARGADPYKKLRNGNMFDATKSHPEDIRQQFADFLNQAVAKKTK